MLLVTRRVLRTMLLPLIFFTFPSFAGAADAAAPPVVQGILDLSGNELQAEVVSLEGEWEFYWMQLLEPGDFTGETARKDRAFIEAPAEWGSAAYTGAASLRNEGYGTYRLRIRLSEADAGRPLSLYVPAVASAYRLWADGRPVAANGVVGIDKGSMVPRSFSKVVTFQPAASTTEIVMQVSNFSQRKGGMWAPIGFGPERNVLEKREANAARDLITASSLFILGLYHIALTVFRITTALPLFLGLFCLIVSLRTLLVGEMLLPYLLPSLPWEWAVKLEYLTFYVGFMVVYLFLARLFPEEANKRVVFAASAACLGFAATTAFPAAVFTHYMLPFQIVAALAFAYSVYVVVLASVRRREGAVVNLMSIVFLALAVWNDMLYYNGWIRSIDLAPIAAFVFLLVQTLIVAKKSSNAFRRVEHLSHELMVTNASLERKVAERTQELQEKNERLTHIERTRKSFFSAIAHEIGTPMQTIQGYVQLLQQQTVTEERTAYLRTIYEKTQMLNRLSKDLLDLAKMEEGPFGFIFESVDAASLVEHIEQRSRREVERSGRSYRFDFTVLEGVPVDRVATIEIDIGRIEQLFANLIHNALKSSPEGGTIRLEGELEPASEERGRLRLAVADDGPGMDPELLPRIFERFVKGKGRTDGSGLGLAICKEIAVRHGGSIVAANDDAGGGRFVVEFPVVFSEGRGDEDDAYHIGRGG